MIAALVAWSAASADEVVYDDSLGALWYNWSWNCNCDVGSTNDPHSGKTAIYAGIIGYGGLSFYRYGSFAHASAIRFWIAGDLPEINVRVEDSSLGITATEIPLSDLAIVQDDEWTEVILPLDGLPAGTWDRLSWVDTSGTGTVIRVDDIELLTVVEGTVPYTEAEPIGVSDLLMPGSGGDVTVAVDGRAVAVERTLLEGAPTRTYARLAEPLTAGKWVITSDDATFTRNVVAMSVTVSPASTHVIPDDIYGANYQDYAPSAGVMTRYGFGSVRWGGPKAARYNPFVQSTNVGAEGFFQNEFVQPSAEDWAATIGSDAATLLTVPNLDWVADGTEQWAYSVEKYGDQEEVSPDNDDAGNGYDPYGARIANDPSDASAPWTTLDVADWLSDFGPVQPDYVGIGDETDLAHVTHMAVVPGPLSYEDQLGRFLGYATTVKDELPNAFVTGPVSSGWYGYWNASGDPADHAEHGDFLPWFLTQVEAADDVSGERTLDVLDVHYTPESLVGKLERTDLPTNALRLRSTRSLWDPTYVDESWIATDPPVTDQPDPTTVMLIPRLQALIDTTYPGTKLAISEWGFGGQGHMSGGLAVADALGIFGATGVDAAMLSPGPLPLTPAAAAFELLRTGDLQFASLSLPVTGYDPDVIGVYASKVGAGRYTLLVVNKDPANDVALAVDGIGHGPMTLEHFGGAVDVRVVEDQTDRFEGTIVVPAYTAVLAEIVPEPPDPTGTTDTTDTDPGTTDTGTPTVEDPRCGCAHGVSPVGAAALLAIVSLRRRRPRRR